MTAKELITQYVDTGIQLPEYQVNKLSNQHKKTYLRKRLLAVKNSDYHDEILADYEFNLLSKELEEKYMSNLVSRGLRHFVKKANDKDAVINKILTLNNNLGEWDIEFLIKTAKDKESVINRILLSDELINNLNSIDILNLLEYAKDKESVINRLLSSDELINKLNSSGIGWLLNYAKDKESVINILIKKGVSKDIINHAIKELGLDLSLIPEGYKNKIKQFLRNI